MRTNSKQVREAIRAHIHECVLSYEGDYFSTFEDAKKHVQNVFDYWSNIHEIRRETNNQKRFSSFLNGLPFNFHFYYEDMEIFLNGLGINPNNREFSNTEIEYKYHYLIFREIFS